MLAAAVPRRLLLHPTKRTKLWHAALARRRLLSTTNGARPDGLDILFFGRDAFSCAVFQQLRAASDVIRTLQIATTPDERLKRRDAGKWSVSPLKELGNELGVPVHEIPAERTGLRTWEPPAPFAASSPPDPAHVLVTASFGRILPGALLARFGADRRLNVHPSLLPALRGPAPIQRALIAGAPRTGVCVIGMTRVVRGGAGVDRGAVWAREEMDIAEGTTFAPLRDELARRGGGLLVDVLRGMLRGDARSSPQEEVPGEAYPYAPFIEPADAAPRWAEQTAEELVRVHNAIGEQRPLTAKMPDGATAVQLHDVSAVPRADDTFAHVRVPGAAFFHKPADALLVRCAGGSLLAARALKLQSSKLVPAKAFWNGVRPAWCGEVAGEGGRKWKVVHLQ